MSTPTARRVVLGLLLAKDGAPLAVRYAIAACALFGITENNVRVTLARLSAEGLIEASGRGAYVIGHAGARLNAAVSEWRRAEERVRPWEGRYVMVHTGPLPRGDRRVVQRRERALALYGLRELERGLFVRPDNLAGGAAALRQRLVAVGLEPDAAVFDAGGFDDVREARITALWDGPALTAAYHAEHERLTTWLARGAELEPEVAARECYLLGGAAIRQVVFDPWLPEPLVDTAARARFVATVKTFDQAGKAIWEAFGEGHARMPVPTVKGELRPRTH
ncbi:MAG: PaaX family transcriptional regulator [Sandaracinaceae bacterium]|nr:PaaX family transcriptional regulator [Sandaracinaceae bacterium]